MTNLKALKKEITRLADVDTLKKELNRLAGEIKSFDVHAALSPQAKQRLVKLEKRFRELMKRITKLQKEVDRSLGKFVTLVRRSTGSGTATAKKAGAKKKSPRRKSPRKAR